VRWGGRLGRVSPSSLEEGGSHQGKRLATYGEVYEERES